MKRQKRKFNYYILFTIWLFLIILFYVLATNNKYIELILILILMSVFDLRSLHNNKTKRR